MAISLRQQKTGLRTNAQGGNNTIVWTNNTWDGSLIVVGVHIQNINNTVTGVTDSQGNAYTLAGTPTQIDAGGGNGFFMFYYAKNINGGVTPTITVAQSSGVAGSACIAAEYRGLDKNNPFDQVKYTGATGVTAISSGAATATDYGNELLVGFGCSDFGNNTYTKAAAFSNLITAANADIDSAMQDQIVYAKAAYTSTMTLGNASDNGGGIITFRGDKQSPYPNSGIRPYPFSPGLAR